MQYSVALLGYTFSWNCECYVLFFNSRMSLLKDDFQINVAYVTLRLELNLIKVKVRVVRFGGLVKIVSFA